MYRRTEDQEILALLRRIEEKLDALQTQQTEPAGHDARRAPQPEGQTEEKQNFSGENTVWNLSQLQYELSNELSGGIETLRRMIREGEKQVCSAKGKYRQ